jgi:hypothetical protein
MGMEIVGNLPLMDMCLEYTACLPGYEPELLLTGPLCYISFVYTTEVTKHTPLGNKTNIVTKEI